MKADLKREADKQQEDMAVEGSSHFVEFVWLSVKEKVETAVVERLDSLVEEDKFAVGNKGY